MKCRVNTAGFHVGIVIGQLLEDGTCILRSPSSFFYDGLYVRKPRQVPDVHASTYASLFTRLLQPSLAAMHLFIRAGDCFSPRCCYLSLCSQRSTLFRQLLPASLRTAHPSISNTLHEAAPFTSMLVDSLTAAAVAGNPCHPSRDVLDNAEFCCET
ncbi:hypothetical protein BDW22DRAFT_853663 [Trametopsis cervina]|nr:hypothetical protein BDW22DRAFT_853663 [Trametopsis cervina]